MKCTAEVEVGKYGTMVLPKSMMNGGEFIFTGWPDTNQPGDPDGPGPNEHWNKVKVGDKETHRVWVSQVKNETELLDELVRQEIRA